MTIITYSMIFLASALFSLCLQSYVVSCHFAVRCHFHVNVLMGNWKVPVFTHWIVCLFVFFMLSTQYDYHATIRRPFFFFFFWISLDLFKCLHCEQMHEPVVIVVWNRHHVRLLQQHRQQWLTSCLCLFVCPHRHD